MNVSLTKVSGVCAILTTASCLPWMVLPIIAPAIGIEFPQSLEWEDWARLKVDHRSVFLTVDWLVILCLIFETAAVVGFFYVLRVAGPLTWLGLAAWLTGLQLVMLEHIFVLGIDSVLMPRYVAASSAVQPALDVLASTLNGTRFLAALVGNILVLGVGVPVFALAILRTRLAPSWIGWLGLVIAVMTWAGIGAYFPDAPDVYHDIARLAFVGFLVWLVAMGVAWLRMRGPAGNSTVNT